MSTEAEQREEFSKLLFRVREWVARDKVEWIAISVGFTDDSTIALHTEEAPNRPRGVKT